MESKKPIVLIPMAGEGSRFAKAGYKDIKPLIDVAGKPMIERVIDSIGIDADYVFIIQYFHRTSTNIITELERIRPGSLIIDTRGGTTQGAACTVLLAQSVIDSDRPLLIVNSDNIFDWDGQAQYDAWLARDTDGMILVFEDTNPKWSFVREENGLVTEVAEKRPISNLATAGLYGWKRGADFVHAARLMIEADERVNNEFYVAPTYNWLIRFGGKVEAERIRAMHGVGTPEDLNVYLKGMTNIS